ncbi:MAG: response regulator [Candidatus Sulfotelmatobacter sp.]
MSLQKILVVDDEAQMRRVLRASLSARGYQVVEAESGEEALNKLKAERCDFVLLDLNLPGMDGIETCRAIRAGSNVPVVILSVRTSEKDKSAAREAGADDYITKPFGIEELLSDIDGVSRKKPGLRS